jgi:hypothetical protein
MKLNHIKSILNENKDKNIIFKIKDYEIPHNFHLTEVGIESKVFIDCGGTKRSGRHCTLQIWVANDTDHRLLSTKMHDILMMSNEIIDNDDIEVRVEYEKEVTSQYTIRDFSSDNSKIIFNLESTHTNCLAPEKCGVDCCSPLINLS